MRSGETGIAIARAYGVEWSRIVAANDLAEPYILRTGMRVLIPGVAGGGQTINVNAGAPAAPAGAAKPSTPDESALASQAGWAGANEAVAPYLGDWRATPAQILAAAVGGYNRSRYAAQQDIAAQRRADEAFGLQKQQFEAELADAQQKREAAKADRESGKQARDDEKARDAAERRAAQKSKRDR